MLKMKGGTESSMVYWIFTLFIIVSVIAIIAGTVEASVNRVALTVDGAGEAYVAQALAYQISQSGTSRSYLDEPSEEFEPAEEVTNHLTPEAEARYERLEDLDGWCVREESGFYPREHTLLTNYFIRVSDGDDVECVDSDIENAPGMFTSIFVELGDHQIEDMQVYEVTPGN